MLFFGGNGEGVQWENEVHRASRQFGTGVRGAQMARGWTRREREIERGIGRGGNICWDSWMRGGYERSDGGRWSHPDGREGDWDQEADMAKGGGNMSMQSGDRSGYAAIGQEGRGIPENPVQEGKEDRRCGKGEKRGEKGRWKVEASGTSQKEEIGSRESES